MAVNLNEIKQMLDTLSPTGQQEVALLVQRLADKEAVPSISEEGRHRILDELCGSMPREDADELIRLTREAHDECICQSQ